MGCEGCEVLTLEAAQPFLAQWFSLALLLLFPRVREEDLAQKLRALGLVSAL